MSGRHIIRDENQKDAGVLGYRPKRIEAATPEAVVDFTRQQHLDMDTGFHINPLLANQTGITKTREADLEAELEEKMIQKMKKVQEEAYQQGYQQGLEDGEKRAFTETQEHIRAGLEALDNLGKRIESLIHDLAIQNEAQLVDMVFYLARNLALRDITENPEAIKDILLKVVDSVKSDEQVTIRVSELDSQFLEEMRAAAHRDFEFLSRMKITVSPQLQKGGCIIETNYGTIEADLETRVQKLWELIQERKPKIESSVA